MANTLEITSGSDNLVKPIDCVMGNRMQLSHVDVVEVLIEAYLIDCLIKAL